MRKISLIAISLAFVASTAMADETAATWRLEAQHQNYTVYAGSLKRVRICSTNQPVSVSWGSRQHTVVSPKSCADIEGEQIVLGNQGVVAAEGTYMVLSR